MEADSDTTLADVLPGSNIEAADAVDPVYPTAFKSNMTTTTAMTTSANLQSLSQLLLPPSTAPNAVITRILKNQFHYFDDNSRRRHPKKDGKGFSSKYMGVYRDTYRKKTESYSWRAQMMIDKKVVSLGRFDNEEEAADAYARACIRHKTKKPNPDEMEVYGGLDLKGIPEQSPILKDTRHNKNRNRGNGVDGKNDAKKTTKNPTSPFKGVKYMKGRWQARIQDRTLGTFDTDREAGSIYARAAVLILQTKDSQNKLKQQQQQKQDIKMKLEKQEKSKKQGRKADLADKKKKNSPRINRIRATETSSCSITCDNKMEGLPRETEVLPCNTTGIHLSSLKAPAQPTGMKSRKRTKVIGRWGHKRRHVDNYSPPINDDSDDDDDDDDDALRLTVKISASL